MHLRHKASFGLLSCCCGCTCYVGMVRLPNFVMGALQQMDGFCRAWRGWLWGPACRAPLRSFCKMTPWLYACLAQASALLCSQAAVMPCREAKQEFTAAADAHRAQQQKVDNALHQVILSFPQLCPWRQQPKAAIIEVVLGVTVCYCRG